MFVRLVRDVRLRLYDHDPESGEDLVRDAAFPAGTLLRLGEVSDNGDGTATVEFVGMGYATLADADWDEHPGAVFFFADGPPCLN